MSPHFYRAFEDRYRGSRASIKQRLRAYAGFVAPLAAAAPAAALDLGCGRGEWLELLGEAGIAARGVDLDDGMLAACRELGLEVQNQDALAALRAQPDDSLALVSAFHLVEHIPFALVRELIAEALRALRPGGLLIMETPNPENLSVGAHSFYMDPSHLHPLPPSLLSFAVEHAGFGRHQVLRLQEDPALHGAAQVGLITVLEGVSPDYGVVAQKAAAAPALQAFDSSFNASYGITLGQLAQRYDAQDAQRHAEIHHLLGRLVGESQALALRCAASEQSHAQLAQSHAQLAQSHAQLEQSSAMMAQSNILMEQRLLQRIEHTERHAEAMGQRVLDLLSSSSWRLTAPLRRAMTAYLQTRAALRASARQALLQCGAAVLRRPRLKRGALALLRWTPGWRARLQRLLYSQAAAPTTPAAAPAQLSPRAARAYHALKQAQQARRKI